MSGICACFDLDETLVTSACKIDGLVYTRHLEQIDIKISGVFRRYYAICMGVMGKIFEDLLRQRIPIAIITKSSYEKEVFMKVLEMIYRLKPEALKDIIFINRKYTEEKGLDKKTVKGVIMGLAVNDGILPADKELVLIDNDRKHIDSAIASGFKAIHVKAIPEDETMPDCSYIFEIIRLFKLVVRLSMLEEINLPIQIAPPSALTIATGHFKKLKM